MTTFMAKLLQKLTEMSCNLANDFIVESNDLLKALKKGDDQGKRRGNFESKVNLEIPIDFMKEYEFSEDDDGMQFESNTQLLTDDSIDVSQLVT